MSRRPIYAANWKMNHLRADAERYCMTLSQSLATSPPQGEVVVFPPFPLLSLLARGVGDHASVGGQDLHPEASGAHTGDVSAEMLGDAGCEWALCGHSERRRDHHESDSLVVAKATAARRAGLRPLVCLGETLEQRQGERTREVLATQLDAVLEAEIESFDLAYEPVWAIGTGETATPEIAQESHLFLRQRLAETLGEERAQRVRILYGGSVKPGNCAALIAENEIDGFLIGGASLDPAEFLDIIRRSDPVRD